MCGVYMCVVCVYICDLCTCSMCMLSVYGMSVVYMTCVWYSVYMAYMWYVLDMYMHTCTCLYTEMWRVALTSCCLPYVLRQGLLLNQESGPLNTKSLRFPCLTLPLKFPALGLQAYTTMPAFYVAAADMSLGLYACPESVLPEPRRHNSKTFLL